MLGIPFTTRNITVSNKSRSARLCDDASKVGEATGTFGIASKAGRYGGTYALMFPRETIIFEGSRSSHMIRFTRRIGPIHKAAHA